LTLPRQRILATRVFAAMILRSAKELGCASLHSEDLNPGQSYQGVQVRNPFLA
jgi:predicted nucleic acid-binding protein